ncbi:hypothetical protein AMATHDRAFT_149102 [Amanita thiersii Skay4041]|uniref:Major facilitator superfamily (MFS) profile domain-containing protein n=1 Tax=Amanita thiersii Skay4041 TaxID=703135 RepID=A0A2A9NM53_9AGAR|nr:hypothetical protein AMATHDRAFT_149102 [Amanita thiersii Skay4041]
MSVHSSTTCEPVGTRINEVFTGKDDKYDDPLIFDPAFKVLLDETDDPQCMPTLRKWVAITVISSAALCVTSASSLAAFTESGIEREFGVSHTVAILGISLFVAGLGTGPLLAGPLSEVYGRNYVYQVSYGLFFAFSWPVAFAPNISVHLIFRYATGFCGATFLSVAGGSVSDMFSNATVANPMAVYTISPFIGPVIGPLIGGFINQNLNWRWTYYIVLIWVFCELLALFIFVPETYVPVILQRKAAKLRRQINDERYWSELDEGEKNLMKAIIISCYKPFQLLLLDRMALLLSIWTALILGILYLAFQAFPFIFTGIHGFNMQFTGMSFLGIGVGMLLALATQPLWNRLFSRESARFNGRPPPEIRLVMGQVGGVLVPLSLYWLAFTTYRNVPWIIPIIASALFGTGIIFVFTSVFTYLVTAYRPIAASAMAANSALRSAFAAAFPLFARAMYLRLGSVGATALLAGLTTIMAPLPFIFRKYGSQLRAKSRFAV